MFDWHNPWDAASDLARLRAYEPGAVVLGWQYWLAGDFNFGPLRKELTKFLGGYEGAFSWYMTPVRGPSEADHHEFRARNRGMRSFVQARRCARPRARRRCELTSAQEGGPAQRERAPERLHDAHGQRARHRAQPAASYERLQCVRRRVQGLC